MVGFSGYSLFPWLFASAASAAACSSHGVSGRLILGGAPLGFRRVNFALKVRFMQSKHWARRRRLSCTVRRSMNSHIVTQNRVQKRIPAQPCQVSRVTSRSLRPSSEPTWKSVCQNVKKWVEVIGWQRDMNPLEAHLPLHSEPVPYYGFSRCDCLYSSICGEALHFNGRYCRAINAAS